MLPVTFSAAGIAAIGAGTCCSQTDSEGGQAALPPEVQETVLDALLGPEVRCRLCEYADIVEIFANLQTASQEEHLPAFERASARY